MTTKCSDLPFQHFVAIVFNNWTALKLAIEHGMGGNPVVTETKVNRMIETVSSLLSSGNEWESVSDTLADIMDAEFSTLLDDNSSDEVGFQLSQLYQMYSTGNLQEITASLSHLPITVPINLNRIQICPTKKTSEEEHDEPQNQTMQSEEDLEWTIVKRR